MDLENKLQFVSIEPQEVNIPQLHGYLLGAVTPRPIAFASTIDKQGRINLSPFSFFNVFSANPPIMIFSPARRVKDNSTKHSLNNVLDFPETTINIVNYSMVEQMSLSSSEYKAGINEFVKAGFTMIDSVKVKPPRVGESPVSFECKVNEVIPLGKEGGAGNLVICEVVFVHIRKEILDDQNRIDPFKLDAVGRLGGNWYTRVAKESIFDLPKPGNVPGIGIDNIPGTLRDSVVLTGNDFGRLGSVEQLPEVDEINKYGNSERVKDLRERFENDRESFVYHQHLEGQSLLTEGKTIEAWLLLLQRF